MCVSLSCNTALLLTTENRDAYGADGFSAENSVVFLRNNTRSLERPGNDDEVQPIVVRATVTPTLGMIWRHTHGRETRVMYPFDLYETNTVTPISPLILVPLLPLLQFRCAGPIRRN
jgi:hypothetical protein